MKGQITVFIIVGIVILFVLAFGMYLFSTLQKQEVSIGAVQDEGSRACLEQVSEQAIEEVLLRGGAGTAAEFTAEQYRIAVRQGTPVKLHDMQNYGLYNFQTLCLAQGANRPNAAGDFTNTCMLGTYQVFEADDEVLQYALQQLIYDGLGAAGCTQAPVTVIFGGDDVTVRTENATARIDVRFKRIYNLAHSVIVKEIKDIDFDMTDVKSLGGCNEPLHGNECVLPGLSVATDTTSPHTIVVVRDSTKLLHGRPAEMRFVIENRYPVLLGAQTISATAGEETTTSYRAEDPDEDAVTAMCGGVSWVHCSLAGSTLTVTTDPPCGTSDEDVSIRVCDQHNGLEQSCNIQTVPISVSAGSC